MFFYDLNVVMDVIMDVIKNDINNLFTDRNFFFGTNILFMLNFRACVVYERMRVMLYSLMCIL